jgi:transposase
MDKKRGKSPGKQKKYSDAFKRQVAQAYLMGQHSMKEVAVKFDLPNQWTVKDFVSWYKSEPEEMIPPAPLSEAEQKEVASLQKRIKELEKQLSHEQLRALGFETMIDIAEKELKIDIRKKSYTKPSKP